MELKTLFFDIDGVVCLHKENANWSEEELFDADCCRRLKEILLATGCKLVLSSSWRLFPDSVRQMFRQFKPFGITKGDFLGRTPLLDERGEEILTYLRRHPYITEYIALDDEPFYGSTFPRERLILTEAESGITEEIREKCIKKLNK